MQSNPPTPILPPELLHQIALVADRNLLRKLLFIRPFHQVVLTVVYAECRQHVLLKDLRDGLLTVVQQKFIIETSPLHQAYATRIHFYWHILDGAFESRERERKRVVPDLYLQFGNRRLAVYIHGPSKEENAAYAMHLIRNQQLQVAAHSYWLSLIFPCFAVGFHAGANLMASKCASWNFRFDHYLTFIATAAFLLLNLVQCRNTSFPKKRMCGAGTVGFVLGYLMPIIITRLRSPVARDVSG